MKKRLLVLLLASLSGILFVSGCKEAAPNIGAQPSEDIFGYWESTDPVDTGDFTIAPKATFYIIRDGNTIDVRYSIVPSPDEIVIKFAAATPVYSWSGDISPDPSTSVNLTITVGKETVGPPYAPPEGAKIPVSYVLTDNRTGIFTVDGNSFNVEKVFLD